MNTEEFKVLSERYGPYASWAIWDESNTRNTAIIGQSLSELHARYVLLGLNISAPLKEHWSNFHFGRHDRKLIKAFNRSLVRGAYMTDILKDLVEADSGKLNEIVKKREFITPHIDYFEKELAAVGASQETVFILFGGKVAELFPSFVPKKYRQNKRIRLIHYSYYGMTDEAWVSDSLSKIA